MHWSLNELGKNQVPVLFYAQLAKANAKFSSLPIIHPTSLAPKRLTWVLDMFDLWSTSAALHNALETKEALSFEGEMGLYRI